MAFLQRPGGVVGGPVASGGMIAGGGGGMGATEKTRDLEWLRAAEKTIWKNLRSERRHLHEKEASCFEAGHHKK